MADCPRFHVTVRACVLAIVRDSPSGCPPAKPGSAVQLLQNSTRTGFKLAFTDARVDLDPSRCVRRDTDHVRGRFDEVVVQTVESDDGQNSRPRIDVSSRRNRGTRSAVRARRGMRTSSVRFGRTAGRVPAALQENGMERPAGGKEPRRREFTEAEPSKLSACSVVPFLDTLPQRGVVASRKPQRSVSGFDSGVSTNGMSSKPALHLHPFAALVVRWRCRRSRRTPCAAW